MFWPSMNQSRSRTQSCSNLLATLGPCLFDLLQAHFSVAEFSTDRPTEEAILIKHMDFSHIGRVVSDQKLFLDKGRQVDVHVAMVLKVNPILLDPTRLCHR